MVETGGQEEGKTERVRKRVRVRREREREREREGGDEGD